MTTNVKHARILKDHTLVLKRNKQGVPRAEKDFKASDTPVPVTRAQLDALIEAGVAEEAPAPTSEAATSESTTSTASTAQTGDSKSTAASGGKKA